MSRTFLLNKLLTIMDSDRIQPITIKRFCRMLPKVELHAHLNGSLNENILQKLGCNKSSIAEYQKLTNIVNKNSRTLEECFALFDVAYNATATKENLYLAAKSVIEDFEKDNTIYLELRTTPRDEKEMSKEDYIETVIKAINDCKSSCQILVKLILSINRRSDAKAAENQLEVILKMKDMYPDIIKGVDLSGNPEIGTFDEQLFEKARKHGLKTAIHCAEVKNDDEVKRILNFNPDRLGHVVFLHPSYGGSEENWNIYCEKKIPVECCLTSNVICGTVQRYEEHHIQEWINLNLPFSICTDDKGVFRTDLSSEYEYFMKYFKLRPEDLYQCSEDAIEQSFASEEEKKLLTYNLTKWLYTSDNIFSLVQQNLDDLDVN